jgi:DNA-binding LacI/PurR family transcriptional regulator
MAGFEDAATRHGVRATAQPCAENFEAVRETTAALLARRPDLTGLVVHNEAAVGHVLTALRALGRRVPEDMSVVAICPDEVAERTTPPLSSVLIPAEEVGHEAVSLLMRKLVGEQVRDATLLDPRLTARASTAPAHPAVTPVPASASTGQPVAPVPGHRRVNMGRR